MTGEQEGENEWDNGGGVIDASILSSDLRGEGGVSMHEQMHKWLSLPFMVTLPYNLFFMRGFAHQTKPILPLILPHIIPLPPSHPL